MDEQNEIMPQDLDLIEIDSLTNTLATYIEQGTESAMKLFESDEIAVIWETAQDITEDLKRTSKFLAVFRKVSSIPDKLFMKRIEKYCRGLTDIPVIKRKEYVEKVGKASLNRDSVFILGVLNRIEELSKIDILVALFEAKVNGAIDDETYRRLSLLVDRTMFSDLLYLKANITDDPIVITNDAEQGLLTNGWLYYLGQTFGSAAEDGHQVYSYTNIAKRFCTLINF